MPPYLVLPVHPALQAWVESIFIMNLDFEDSPYASVYEYPWSVSTHLYFTISEEPLYVKEGTDLEFKRYPRNFIIGPRLSNYIVDLGSKRHVAAVAFRPGGLHRLFGLSMAEITDIELDASLVWNKDIRELSERLLNAVSNEEVFKQIENFLLKKCDLLKPIQCFDYAVAELVTENGNLSVTKLADLACLSIRQLERKALSSLGVSPKLFSRITRFINASLYKEHFPSVPWSQVAYRFGFADQMHLINDFKKFSGYTPKGFDKTFYPSVKLLTAIEGKL